MNWENIGLDPEEKAETLTSYSPKQTDNTIQQQNEQKRLVQLRKLESGKNDEHRKVYKTIITKFGDLLLNNSIEEIASSLMTEDCETFLFGFAEKSAAQYAFKDKGFIDLYNGYRVVKREVKETFVDLEKKTGFQFSDCSILNKKEDIITSQFSFEVFSFKNEKISKYRALYGSTKTSKDSEDIFTPSRKERMLAKIKELNYAWVDQPDLERIASLLHESTDYKLWRWKDKQCFTFHKSKLVSEFRKSLEEEFEIKSIVPYDVTSEGQYVVGSYVFHLEGKGELAGQKFMWISTCIYSFDKDFNISKMSQQGELFDEDEIVIPFEVDSEERIREKIDTIYNIDQVSVVNNEDFHFSFELGIFGAPKSYYTGVIKGLSEYTKLTRVLRRNEEVSKISLPVKPIDSYFDLDDPYYDTVITIGCARATIEGENNGSTEKVINWYSMRKFAFENGKLAKMLVIVSGIREPIPSPYDDNEFVCENIRPKNEFL